MVVGNEGVRVEEVMGREREGIWFVVIVGFGVLVVFVGFGGLRCEDGKNGWMDMGCVVVDVKMGGKEVVGGECGLEGLDGVGGGLVKCWVLVYVDDVVMCWGEKEWE